MTKINSLEIENVKRIKAVKIEPSINGLTVIGGNNNQGKTSVLDSIAWALGGNKYKPTKAQREGSNANPTLKIVLDNGLIVERKGKNGTLKVTDPEGKKSGQNLLDTFVEELALNLPKFMNASNKEKADFLLKIIGVEQELAQIELRIKGLYNDRLTVGRIKDQKSKYAEELIHYEGVPSEPISPSDLIQQQQEILARNGENQRKRANKAKLEQELVTTENGIKVIEEQIAALKVRLDKGLEYKAKILEDLEKANMDILGLIDEGTEELENNLRNIEEVNVKVRANLDKEKAEMDAKNYQQQYDDLTVKLNAERESKTALLKGANLPLSGLSVEDGELTYNNQKWDNMSGSDQLKVSTAIIRKLNPDCGFVLLDKLEQMDLVTLNDFGKWLEAEGLQAIATRVSKGDECSVIIEDGYVLSTSVKEPVVTPIPSADAATWNSNPNNWEEGKF